MHSSSEHFVDGICVGPGKLVATKRLPDACDQALLCAVRPAFTGIAVVFP